MDFTIYTPTTKYIMNSK